MKHLFVSGALTLLSATILAQKPQLIPPMSHAAHVRAAALSPDGKRLLTCAGYLDNTVLLWDAAEGSLLKIMEGHYHDIWDAEYSPDGKYMLTLETETWAVHVWDKDGRELRSLTHVEGSAGGVPECVQNVCFSHDSKYILAGTCGGKLVFLDLNGKPARRFEGGDASINEVAVSNKGTYVASCDDVGIIRVFKQDGTLLYELDGHGQKQVESIEFTPDEQFLVSGGHDNMAVVWDLSDGSNVYQLGPHDTEVRTIAISSDGAIIATAGPNSAVVKLWDSNGEPLQDIQANYANEILFFSGDTSILVAPLYKAAQEFALDGELIYAYTNEASPVTSVGFSPFSPDSLFIVTAGEGRHLRIWDVVQGTADPLTIDPTALPLEGIMNGPAAFYPDEPILLAGHAGDSLFIYDLYTFDEYSFEKPAGASTSALAWGGEYFATSDFTGGVQLWTVTEEGELVVKWNKRVPSNYVTSLEFTPDGDGLLTALSRDWMPSLAQLNEHREQPDNGAGFPAALRSVNNFNVVRTYGKTSDQVALSPDGKFVATNEGEEHGLSLFDFQTAKEVFHISLPRAGSKVFCMAFSSNSESIVVGCSDNVAREYDLRGKLIREYKGHYSAVRSVAFSPYGDYVITGSSDNTAKIWDAKTGKEIVTLMAVGNEDWVVITPEGLFDASPGAMEDLYFVVGMEVVPLEQLKSRYWDPHLLAKVMGFSEEERLKAPALTNVNLYPDIKARIENDQLKVELTAQGSGGLGKLSLFVNGKQLLEDANPGKKSSLSIDLKPYWGWCFPGEDSSTVALQAVSEGWLSSPLYSLRYLPTASGKGQNSGNNTTGNPQNLNEDPPSLYAVIIGTSQYAGAEMKLTFPDVDAERFHDALQVAGKGLFNERVSLKLLSSTGTAPAALATKANIKAAFEEFEKKAQPQDVFMVFFSGHGKTLGAAEKSKFYYLTKDIKAWSDLENPQLLAQNTISSDEIIGWLKKNKAAKQVLILDACNAASLGQQFGATGKGMTSAQIRVADEMKNLTGTYILAGAAGDKESFEAPRYGQGLLTYSLLDGMRGEVRGTDNKVDILKLINYACSKVPKLAGSIGKTQEPEMFLPKNTKGGFFIGIVTSPEQIMLPKAMPVIVRNNLFDPNTGNDDLGLTKVLKETLWEKMSSKIVYYDTDEYPDAYRITGPYKTEGDVVKVTVNVYQNKKLVKTLDKPVEGNKNDLPALANAILKAVGPFLK
ncbi:MAG: caspase family protein [Saprospiraceae bacterium]|nr:caspase family protein [Saprospiraceae bacterium]